MCEHGTTVPLMVVIPARLSHTGEARLDMKAVDACIAPIVKVLNDAGVPTVSSCCGHGKGPGNIALADGRELLIMRTNEDARSPDYLWPDIHGEPAPPSPEPEEAVPHAIHGDGADNADDPLTRLRATPPADGPRVGPPPTVRQGCRRLRTRPPEPPTRPPAPPTLEPEGDDE